MANLIETIWNFFQKQGGRPETSWDKYKDYLKIHPTAIIDPGATIN